jgi:hypothetical protein
LLRVVWMELEYQLDVYRVTSSAYVEHFWVIKLIWLRGFLRHLGANTCLLFLYWKLFHLLLHYMFQSNWTSSPARTWKTATNKILSNIIYTITEDAYILKSLTCASYIS